MTHTRKNKGVCSAHTTVRVANGVVEDVEVMGGCDGNLQGVCTLLRGRSAQDAIALLEGIYCGDKTSSCPQEIAKCLKEALEQGESGAS